MGGCCFNLIFSSNIFKNSKNQSEWLLVDFPRQRAYFWMPFLRNLEVLDISFSFDTYEWWVGPGSQRCHRSRGIILHGVVSLWQVRTTIPFVDRWARAEGFLCFGADSPRGYMPVLMQKTTMAHACSRDKHASEMGKRKHNPLQISCSRKEEHTACIRGKSCDWDGA